MENKTDEQQVYRFVDLLKRKITKGQQFTSEEKEEFDKLLYCMAQNNIVVEKDDFITIGNN